MDGRDTYQHGSWNVVCDRCGAEYKAHQLSKEWTGLMVCRGPGTRGCWEPRHPQDFAKGRKDNQSPPWVRPEPPDQFVQQYAWNDVTKAWEAV